MLFEECSLGVGSSLSSERDGASSFFLPVPSISEAILAFSSPESGGREEEVSALPFSRFSSSSHQELSRISASGLCSSPLSLPSGSSSSLEAGVSSAKGWESVSIRLRGSASKEAEDSLSASFSSEEEAEISSEFFVSGSASDSSSVPRKALSSAVILSCSSVFAFSEALALSSSKAFLSASARRILSSSSLLASSARRCLSASSALRSASALRIFSLSASIL